MNFSKFGNKLTLTSACLLTNLILAGFMVQIGLLTEPISRTFDVEITYAAKQFSFLYGGYFAGSIIAFFILDYVSIRVALLTNCVIIILSTVVLYILKSVVLLPLIFAVIGIMGGIAACIAGTIISIIWQKKFRDSLLLAQDASFNLGGSLYPLLTAIILTSAKKSTLILNSPTACASGNTLASQSTTRSGSRPTMPRAESNSPVT